MGRNITALALVILVAAPAHAQLAVIDPANLAQTILIVQRTQRQLEELRAEYLTVQRMAQRLGRMDQFRTPPFAQARHDAGRWTFAGPWIAGLNLGDPTGAGYLATALPLMRPDSADRLSGEARRA